ncbi:organic hydroperoxide resistance protein [Gottfriedia solisilvae]|uniref:Organic hydroperoxide resistance protein n=1 Tax=Gottfriedia solisilvae TaxID=1516104 RepID=A0A8J3F2T1_9BACI|nr:organic hydroperoxide resistance protein [Gottfriedia solisilvae]GGI18031.1 organic hydroperoxide resistance protein [Gottfriedia solisilvae]
MEHLYTATATATGGREGRVVSSDEFIDLALKMPVELGGPGGATNPEQLFAAGYSACFESALNLVAREKKVKLQSTSVTANVTIGKDPVDGGFKLAVQLNVKAEGVPTDLAVELVKAAHGVCPYSKATQGNIDVQLRVIG